MLIRNRKLRKACLFAALLLPFPCVSAFAMEERWSIAEGPSGDIRGVWTMTLNGDEMSGWAEMFDSAGEPVTYFVSGKRENDEFVLERQSPSNGMTCNYRLKGTPPENGEPFNGGSQCDGKSQVWTAKKMHEPEETGASPAPSMADEQP